MFSSVVCAFSADGRVQCKMVAKVLLALTAFVAITSARRFIKPMENPDLYHGDIAGEDDTRDRNAHVSKKRRWPNGVIQYEIDPGLKELEPRIRKAMKHIEDNTCVTFAAYDGTEESYIRIFSGEGCYSYWGRLIRGQQPVSLGGGCEDFGTIVHELLHTVGFDHEQNRSDRDDYLIVYYENIHEDGEYAFRKLLPHQNWLITPFDYDSIMIYGEYAYSKDGNSKTMVAKKPGVRLIEPYYKDGLAPSDIKRINILYEC